MKQLKGPFICFLFLVLILATGCIPLPLRIPATGPEPTLVPTIHIPTPTATQTATSTPVMTATTINTPTAAVTSTATPLPVPTVQVTYPVEGVQINTGQQVIVQAAVTAPAGISRIELWVDGALIDTVPNTNTALTSIVAKMPFSTQVAGQHFLSILAYDTLNQAGAAGPFKVIVAAPSVPQAGFNNPSGKQVVIASGQNLQLNYWAASSVGVGQVELWVDGHVAFSDDGSSASMVVFQHTWSTNAAGNHAFFIRVHDTAQNLSDSGTLTVTVNPVSAPTVAITAPLNKATVPAGQAVQVAISASGATTGATTGDTNSIMHIELWIDGALYSSWDSTNAAGETPVHINFAWQNPAVGSHQLSAVAFNKGGASTRSPAVQVNVAVPTVPPAPSVTPVPSATMTLAPTITPVLGPTVTSSPGSTQ